MPSSRTVDAIANDSLRSQLAIGVLSLWYALQYVILPGMDSDPPAPLRGPVGNIKAPSEAGRPATVAHYPAHGIRSTNVTEFHISICGQLHAL